MNNFYINLFRIPKVLMLILVGVLFSINPNVLSSQNLVTCTFDSNPSSTLYTCASNVTAEITTSNLPAGYDQLIIFYPLQFELVSVNNMPPPVNPVLASFSFDPPVGEEVLVQGQQIEIPVLSNTGITYEFAVRSCYPQNGTAPQSYPAYFEAYVSNGTPDHIEAIFSQPQQYFGSQGIVQFNNISTQPFTLISNQLFPTILNPGDSFDRFLEITLHPVDVQSVDLMGFTVFIDQEADVSHEDLEIQLSDGSFLSLGPPQFTYNIGSGILNLLNLNETIILKQECKLNCNVGLPLITTINVSLLCGDCDPITQSWQFDSQPGISRPFSISQNVADNTTINSNCSADFINLVSIDFDESNLEFFIPTIQVPVNSDFFNVDFVKMGNSVIPPAFFNINSNNILTIDLVQIANSGNNLQLSPLVLNNLSYRTPSGAFTLEIELGMSYRISEFQTCQFDNTIRLNEPNQNAIVALQNVCNNINLITESIEHQIEIRNSSYTLTGGPEISDFSEGFHTAIPFEFNFYTSGNVNPLALYQTNNPQGTDLYSPCQNSTYALYLSAFASELTPQNGLSYFNTGNVQAIINGGTQVSGTYNGTELVFNLPSNTTGIYNIQFNLTLLNQNCPFLTSDDNSGYMNFAAEIRAVCNTCTNNYRTLSCVEYDPLEVNFHCLGDCGGGDNPVDTYFPVTIERISLGWSDQSNYENYHNSEGISSPPIVSKAALLSIIQSQNPTLTESERLEELENELAKVYPYDLVQIESKGKFTKYSDINSLYFQVIHSPLSNSSNPAGTFLQLENATISFYTNDTYNNSVYQTQMLTVDNFIQENLNVPDLVGTPLTTFELHPQDQVDINFLTNMLPSQSYFIKINAVFRIEPFPLTLQNNAYNATGSTDITIRGLFVASSSSNTPVIYNSCDTYASGLTLLRPGIDIQKEPEVILDHGVYLLFDEMNAYTPTYNFLSIEESEPNLHSYCNSNSAFGIYLFGGLGPTIPDFKYEYRPQISWPFISSISTVQSSSRLIAVNTLYNNASSPALNVDNSTQVFSNNNAGIALQPSFMKGVESFRYQGLAFSLEKDSHTSLVCPNASPNPTPNFSIDFGQIGVKRFSYVHPIASGQTNQIPIPNNVTNAQSLSSQLGTLSIPNNPFVLNSQNLCNILSGSITESELNVAEDLIYEFTVGAPTNDLETKNIWVSYVIKREYYPNPTSPLTTDYFYPSFDATTWSTTLDLENGYIVQNQSDNNQFVYYFPQGLSQDVPISIPSFELPCEYETLELEILFGMYCDDESINTHFSANPPETCFNCAKTIQLHQQSGVNYLNTSSFTFDDCALNWNIQLENPVGNLSISNTEIILGLPEGLILNGIVDGDITYAAFNAQQPINLGHNLSITGASLSGAASGDVQTVLHFTFPNQPTFEYGSQLNLNLHFQFAQELCTQIEDKMTTGLELYLLGNPACSENNEQIITPINSVQQLNPIPFADIPNLETLLSTSNSEGGTCCNSLAVQYSVLGACPGYSNGSLSITDITQTDLDGNDYSVAVDCLINIFGPDGSQIQTGIFVSDMQPIQLDGLEAGTYIIEVLHTLIVNNQPVTNSFIEGFVINSSPENCACDCDDANLYVIDIPASITNSTDFTQYLIDNGFYFPNDDNNEYVAPYVDNKCIKLASNFIVNSNFIFSDCEVKIAAGREIRNVNYQGNNNVLELHRSSFSGCDFMWKGFVNESYMNVQGYSVISDAQFGIFINRETGVSTYINQAKFINNFVGIKTQEIQGEHALTLTNVQFSGGTLKTPFPSQFPTQLATSLAGIVLTNEFYLSLDKSIEFNSLCNGVIVHSSALNALRSTFINIQPTSQYIGSEYWLSEQSGTQASGINVGNGNGSGIFGLRSKIKYRGHGDASWAPIMFNSCLNGIFVNNCYIDLEDTRMREVRQGILAINFSTEKVLTIKHNRLEFSNFGIRVIDSSVDENGSGRIDFNTLRAVPNGKTIGISFYGSKSFDLLENDISDCRRGISLTTSVAEVKSNHVSIPNLATGIYVAGSSFSAFECNTLNGNSINSGSNQIGFQLKASPQNEFINNWFNNTNIGFQVSEPSTALRFELNNFNNHAVGFDVTPTGILGDFTSAGNRWLAQSYAIAGARNQAMSSPFSQTATRFIVEPNPSQELRPSHFPSVPQQCQGTFFPCLSTLPTPATLECPEYTTGGGGGGIGGITTVDDDDNFFKLASKVANDSLTFQEFNEELLYSVRKQIERKLSSQELVLPDTGSFATLKYELENGTEEKFNTVDDVLKPQALDSTLHTSIVNDLSSIHALTYALFQTDSLTQEPNVNLEQLRIEREQLAAQLEILQAQMRLIEQGALENQGFKRDSAFYYNNGIVTQKEFEQYEKQINTIYLETFAKGNYVFTYEQAETIHQIATMCPSLGGSAVYKARTLNALLNDTLEYNDELTCLQQGVLYRLAQTTRKQEVSEIQVFPNPSTNQLTIKYDYADAYPLRIEIIDALGRTTSNTLLNSSPAVLSGEISNLASGVYIYRISDNTNTIVKQHKLIKQ